MDVADLRNSYAALSAAARGGGFSAPGPGQWTAEQILAHVIVNDRLLATVTADLIDDGEPSYDNEPSQRRSLLDAVVASCPDLDGLVDELERQGAELCALAAQLDDTSGPRRVTVRLLDDDDVVLSGPVPWDSLLTTHAARHLPAHLEQLTALR